MHALVLVYSRMYLYILDRHEGCEVGVPGGQARLPHRGSGARGRHPRPCGQEARGAQGLVQHCPEAGPQSHSSII